MIINASDGLEFIEARGTRVTEVVAVGGHNAFSATRQQLMALAEKNAIALEVHRKHGLRYAILCISVKAARRMAGIARGSRIPEQLPVAEDNRTCTRDGRGYMHVAHRCNAYDRIGLTPVDALCL